MYLSFKTESFLDNFYYIFTVAIVTLFRSLDLFHFISVSMDVLTSVPLRFVVCNILGCCSLFTSIIFSLSWTSSGYTFSSSGFTFYWFHIVTTSQNNLRHIQYHCLPKLITYSANFHKPLHSHN